MLYGRDVSNHNGKYNWAAVTPKPGFGFCKASEGLTFLDADCAWNWGEMHRLGILRGAYHYGHPNLDPTRQAEYFVTAVDHVGGLAANDVLALDLEVSDGQSPINVSAWAVKFCGEVQALTGKNCWVYTMHSFITGGYCHGLYDRPLWIASPGAAGNPGSVAPWPVWSAHQYATTTVDLDVFNGDATVWAKLANVPKPTVVLPAPQPPAEPPIKSVTVSFADGSSETV